MTSISAIAVFLALLVAVPVAVLCLQICAAVRYPWGRREPAPESQEPRGSVALIVPAHDEAAGITATVQSIQRATAQGDRIIVVADNCQDATAAVARSLGVEVIERNDPARRGKGFALDFAIRHLERSGPPDVVIMIDADCLIQPDTIDLLSAKCRRTGRPVQARYLMTSAAGEPNPISEFAFRIKNWVRPLGLSNLNWPCPLQGTGMAFPWTAIAGSRLASANIVEDLALGIALVRDGFPPVFLTRTLVSSRFPESRAGQLEQRQRWEQGYLQTMAKALPQLLLEAKRQRSMPPFMVALDLTIPPLVLLLASLVAFTIATAVLEHFGGSALPLGIAASALTLLVASIALAWWQFGRDILPLSRWGHIGSFVGAKLRLYGAMMRDRHHEWRRAERSRGSPRP